MVHILLLLIKMSFFRKDYSAYPQPVVVIPDKPREDESTPHATTEHGAHLAAADTTSTGLDESRSLTDSPGPTSSSDPATAAAVKIARKRENVLQQEQQDLQQGDGSSTHTNTHDSQTGMPQQLQDTTKLADGIMSLLGPIVQEMDFNIVSVRKSQTELEKEIERLMAGRCN